MADIIDMAAARANILSLLTDEEKTKYIDDCVKRMGSLDKDVSIRGARDFGLAICGYKIKD